MAKRRVLPRKDASKYDAVSFNEFPEGDVPFNDMKTLVFTSSVLDMPSGFPKNFYTSNVGKFRGVDSYVDLLATTEASGVFVTGTMKAGLMDPFLRLDPFYSASGDSFKEDALFEQGNFDVPFFASGSAPEFGDGSFDSALQNKVKFNLSFPVNTKTAMLAKTSSIYYLNVANGTWEIPANAVAEIRGPFEKIGMNVETLNQSRGVIFIEDQVGFDAYGKCLASGSLNKFRNAYPERSHSEPEIGSTYSDKTFADILTRQYPLSIQRNPKYDASENQLFSLPIDYPFLIEKIVYEIPFCFGNDWFLDRTTMLPITASGTDFLNTDTLGTIPIRTLYDEGGPGVTVSLFSQVAYGTGSIRDLIASDVITHSNDKETKLNIYSYNSGTVTADFRVIPVGMSAFTTPGAVVNVESTFTGSVVVKSEASISNGIKTILGGVNGQINVSDDASQQFKNLISDSRFQYFEGGGNILSGIDPFGRAMTGFAPSGGSIFGGEYTLPQDSKLQSSNTIKNQFYTTDIAQIDAAYSLVSATLQQDPSYTCYFTSNVFFMSKKQSPYLVYPGQKLLLSVSKARPVFKNIRLRTNNTDKVYGKVSLVSSSYYYTSPRGHDVQLNIGQLNMTIYGSYVQADGAYIP
jgi:hypothetical protein